MNITTRKATLDDAEDIQAIYSYYVLHSDATFETIAPSIEEMKQRINSILNDSYPFIVAISDSKIVGFTYAKMFYGRDGFKPSVENSVYVKEGSQGLNIGSLLLKALLLECKTMGIENIVAYIGGGEKNIASTKLHKNFGFKLVGIYKDIGFKLGKYSDMSAMQLVLSKKKEEL